MSIAGSPIPARLKDAQDDADVPLAVPPDRLERRFHQSLQNLRSALEFVPDILVYDNTSDVIPFQLVLSVRQGKRVFVADPMPRWARSLNH